MSQGAGRAQERVVNAAYSILVTALLMLAVGWFLTSRYYRWRIDQDRTVRAICPACYRVIHLS